MDSFNKSFLTVMEEAYHLHPEEILDDDSKAALKLLILLDNLNRILSILVTVKYGDISIDDSKSANLLQDELLHNIRKYTDAYAHSYIEKQQNIYKALCETLYNGKASVEHIYNGSNNDFTEIMFRFITDAKKFIEVDSNKIQ